MTYVVQGLTAYHEAGNPIEFHRARPRFLLCVDPGLRATGVALFRERRLVEAACLRTSAAGSRAVACSTMAREVKTWCERWCEPSEVVVEWPQAYTRDKSKGDPNDLFGLAGVCGAVTVFWSSAVVTSYLPREWKKTIDGDVMVARIEERLREGGELDFVRDQTKTYRHNAVDAAGLGLHHLGRLDRQRIFPR